MQIMQSTVVTTYFADLPNILRSFNRHGVVAVGLNSAKFQAALNFFQKYLLC
jgi:hypothetical protein